MGFGTPFLMAGAAVRLRSKLQTASVPFYGAAWLAELLTAHGNAYPNRGVFDLCMGITLGVGTVHALMVRPALAGTATEATGGSLQAQQKAAVAGLHETEAARTRARALAEKNLDEARALGIGRPDLPNRTYPDGGLVDVNAVSGATLASSLGMPADLASRIEALRHRVDRFEDYGDMVMLLNSDGSDVDPYRDQMIFLPTR